MNALLLAALLTAGSSASSTTVADLGWLAGDWEQETGGEIVRETWLPPAGGQMVGVGQTARAGQRSSYEFERIEAKDGVIAFTAVLEGQPPTSFPLLSAKDGEVIFENLTHDYPQRVIYRRCGADLCARTEGTVGGKPQSEDWRYHRMPPAP
jgi:hypothetical protein